MRCNSHSALAYWRGPLGFAPSCLSFAVCWLGYAQAQSSNAIAYQSRGLAVTHEDDNAADAQKRANAFHDNRATVGGEALGGAAKGTFTGAAIGTIAGDSGKGAAFGAAAGAAQGRARNRTKRRRLLSARRMPGRCKPMRKHSTTKNLPISKSWWPDAWKGAATLLNNPNALRG